MTRLLIVDDSPLMRKLLTEIFSEAGDFEISVARSAAEALALMPVLKPDVVTLDVHMPGMDGLACLDQIMIKYPCPVVMVSSLTAEGADETLEALALGAVDFIPKPRGPVSLEIDGIAVSLVAKVRSAAQARIPRTTRLTERVRARIPKQLPAEQPEPPKLRRRRKVRRLDDVAAVVVGVSTGGPPALDILLQPLPADFPWPILIAQHMPASFTGPLARRLDRNCALSISEVTKPVPILPGHVYIGRGDADFLVSSRGGNPIALPAPSDAALLWHPSTDRLVDSAAKILGAERLVGVLLTGMGSDGAQSMARVREAGGHIIAQDAESSVVWGMPGALVERDGADHVLPLAEIAPRLIDWAMG